MLKHRILTITILLGVGAAAAAGYHVLHSPPQGSSAGAASEEITKVKNRVVLTEGKLAKAGIETAPVERRMLQPVRTVPGHIDYNGTRHISVKSPADGLVRKMSVIVGNEVQAGQLLAVINSPELGERRSDVLQQEAELELARRERDWWQMVQTNLGDVVARLKRPQEVAVVEKDFADQVLGDYRRDIFSAYSKYRTAEATYESLKLLTTGAVRQRDILEQTSVRDSAAAAFHGACEQATFDVRQKVGKANAVFEDASRRLAVARQRLNWLTGSSPEHQVDLSKEDSLSTWPLVAPFAATVEEVMLATAERVRQGEDILVLADTTKLWVQADIRDRDWAALSLSPGQKIQVQSQALPDKTMEATIAFIGRTVNPETRAAPLVADIANDDRLLRPGMFVRVLLPDGSPRECIAIPDSALVRHEGRSFVFVEAGPREFAVRDVVVGQTIDPWIEITSGLAAGDRIAIAGTFQLKSELLLEPEE